jgi:hypothetical protein
MGTRYRVTVERLDETTDTILFEATSVAAERLIGFAPDEVLAALVAEAQMGAAEAYPQRVVTGDSGIVARVFDRNGEAITQASEPAVEAEPAKPKRTRRSKAQIAEDEAAAQAAGARLQEAVNGAAERVEQVAEAAAPPQAVTPEPEPTPVDEPVAAPPTEGTWNPFVR